MGHHFTMKNFVGITSIVLTVFCITAPTWGMLGSCNIKPLKKCSEMPLGFGTIDYVEFLVPIKDIEDNKCPREMTDQEYEIVELSQKCQLRGIHGKIEKNLDEEFVICGIVKLVTLGTLQRKMELSQPVMTQQ